jgi:hypothetical protein
MQPPPHAKPAVPDAHFVQRGHMANLRHRRSVAAVVPGLETVLDVPCRRTPAYGYGPTLGARSSLSKPRRESNSNWTLCLVHFSRMGRWGQSAEPTAAAVTGPGCRRRSRVMREVCSNRYRRAAACSARSAQRGRGGPAFGVPAVGRCSAELERGGRLDPVRGAPEHESQLPHCGPHRAPTGVDVG